MKVAISMALVLPYKARVRTMGWLTANVLGPIGGFRKKVRDNLAHVLPDLPESEVRRLTRAAPNNAGRTLIEGLGLADLEKARAERRPVILATGHMGNYDAVPPT